MMDPDKYAPAGVSAADLKRIAYMIKQIGSELELFRAFNDLERLKKDYMPDDSCGLTKESEHSIKMIDYTKRQIIARLEGKFGVVYAPERTDGEAQDRASLPPGRIDFCDWYKKMEARDKRESPSGCASDRNGGRY